MGIEGRSHFLIRMEEEGGAEVRRRPIGLRPASNEDDDEDQRPPADITVLRELLIERQKIHDNEKTTAKQKERFLQRTEKRLRLPLAISAVRGTGNRAHAREPGKNGFVPQKRDIFGRGESGRKRTHPKPRVRGCLFCVPRDGVQSRRWGTMPAVVLK